MRKDILLLALSVVLAVAAAEGLLRLFPALLPLELQVAFEEQSEDRWVDHPDIGHLPAPNGTGTIRTADFEITYQTDAHGFRNVDPWPARADIVAVGDSLTFGYGVERDQAWPALVGRELPDARIVNLGLIGAGPQQHLRIYETFGVPLRPRILLIGFFARNDFWDAEMFDAWLKSDVADNYMVWRETGRVESDTDGPVTEIRGFLQKESYLYNLMRFSRNVYRSWSAGEPKTLRLDDGSRLQLSPSDLESKTVNAQPGSFLFEIAVEALGSIDELAKSNGTRVIVVFQPSKEEVYLPLLDGSAPDAGAPLRSALDARGIEYLDLLPAFRRQAANGAKLFFESDGHPNRQGYQLIADEISAYLTASSAPEEPANPRRLPAGGKPWLH